MVVFCLMLACLIQSSDCSACNGKGRVTQSVTCETCKGAGHLRCSACAGAEQVKCKACQGSGWLRSVSKDRTGWTHDRRQGCKACGGDEGRYEPRAGTGKVACKLCSPLWVCRGCKAWTRDKAIAAGKCAECYERLWEQVHGHMDCRKCNRTGKVDKVTKCEACRGTGKDHSSR